MPAELTVAGRHIPVREQPGRWYDIPLTMAESKACQSNVTIIAANPFTRGNAPVVNTIQGKRIHGRYMLMLRLCCLYRDDGLDNFIQTALISNTMQGKRIYGRYMLMLLLCCLYRDVGLDN